MAGKSTAVYSVVICTSDLVMHDLKVKAFGLESAESAARDLLVQRGYQLAHSKTLNPMISIKRAEVNHEQW